MATRGRAAAGKLLLGDWPESAGRTPGRRVPRAARPVVADSGVGEVPSFPRERRDEDHEIQSVLLWGYTRYCDRSGRGGAGDSGRVSGLDGCDSQVDRTRRSAAAGQRRAWHHATRAGRQRDARRIDHGRRGRRTDRRRRCRAGISAARLQQSQHQWMRASWRRQRQQRCGEFGQWRRRCERQRRRRRGGGGLGQRQLRRKRERQGERQRKW